MIKVEPVSLNTLHSVSHAVNPQLFQNGKNSLEKSLNRKQDLDRSKHILPRKRAFSDTPISLNVIPSRQTVSPRKE